MGQVYDVQNFEFTVQVEFQYKEQLDQFFQQSGVKQQSFDEVSITWFSHRTTLVPSNIFESSSSEDIFRLCFGDEINKSDIDYNRLPEQNMVHVFEMPMWIKSFFIVRFPRAVIQHESSMLLRNIFQGSLFQARILLFIHDKHFTLFLTKEGKLCFYSIFDYQNNNDIVYHLLYAYQQNNFIEISNEILISNALGISENKIDDLQQLLSKVKDFQKSNIKRNHNFIIKSHQLCVS